MGGLSALCSMTDDPFPWGDAATWTARPPDPAPFVWRQPVSPALICDDDAFYGHLLSGYTADGRYLAWVQVGNPWRGVEGWWTGDEGLIDAARAERGRLRDPDAMPLLAVAVVRVLGADGTPDRWTRLVARMAAAKERELERNRRRLEAPDPWVPPNDGS